jgi:hypothetical protein
MDAAASPGTRWRTSSYSGSNGNCVQVARTGTGIAVRDSAGDSRRVLIFPPGQWRVFAAAVAAPAGGRVTGTDGAAR